MISKSISDLEINRNVRRVFVRHNINLGWISISSCHGNVMITGSLIILPGSRGELDPPLIRSMFRDVSRAEGVKKITAELSNWEHDGYLEAWKMKGSSGSRKFDTQQADSSAYDLSKE